MRPKLLALAMSLTSLSAFAQEMESLAGVRLTFENAGARSFAMGGTGAANPASIAGAPRSFTLESRHRTTEARYISDVQLNTIGVDSSTSGITGASLVIPMKSTTWAFSYDEPLKIDYSTRPALAHFHGGSGLLIDRNGHPVSDINKAVEAVFVRLPATELLDVSLRLQRFSTAAAWSRGPVAIGASAGYEHLRQQSGFPAIPIEDILISNTATGTEETIDDHDLTYALGGTWKVTPIATVAASWQSGGAFAGARTFYFGEASRSIELHTPSSLRAGVTLDVLPRLTLAADAVRVRYSDMMHSQRGLFLQGLKAGYPDVTELHAGAEYRIGGIALRGGWWRDPAHALTAPRSLPGPFQAVVAIVDETEDHVTAGIGFGTKTRFDASFDRGTRSTRAAVGVTRTF